MKARARSQSLAFENSWTQDNVLAVIGPFLSTQWRGRIPLANRFKAVSISASAGKPGLAEGQPSVRVCQLHDRPGHDATRSQVLAERNTTSKTAAIVTDIKDALNKSTGQIVMPKLLGDAGIKIIGTSEFVTGEMDFSAQ